MEWMEGKMTQYARMTGGEPEGGSSELGNAQNGAEESFNFTAHLCEKEYKEILEVKADNCSNY